MKLIEQIKASALVSDIDEAVLPIQEILGVVDGGVASMYFSDCDDVWNTMIPKRRERLLVNYINWELCFAKVGS